MNPYAIITSLVLCISMGAGGYWKGRIDNEAEHVESERDALLAYAERIKQGVEQHDKDQIVISGLRTQLSGVRVHIPTTVCPKDSDEAGRLLSVEVDRLFGEFQERISGLVEEADKLNIDAIRANSLMIDEDTRSVPNHKP
jgi:hypothetical protein